LSQFALYRDPIVLDSVEHRDFRLVAPTDHTMASGMHACFLAAGEFAPASREYAIVFVRDPVDGQPQWQPIVMLGVSAGENLFVEAAAGSPWNARYVPAYIRRYPFWTAQLPGLENTAVMIDRGWKGFSRTEGEPLYEPDGKPAARLVEAMGFLEQFEVQADNTLAVCRRLAEFELLREMTANATLADGSTLALNGFFVVDEAKLRALPDAQVIELHRSGALGLVHAHLASLGNLQALLERKAQRLAGHGAPTP